MQHLCPVCGFPHLTESPRSQSGGGSFEICPSCGFQFGVSDADRGFTHEQWRATWKKNGRKWSSRQSPPPDWDPAAQLLSVEKPRRKTDR